MIIPKLVIRPDIRPTLHDINQSFNLIKTDRYNGIKGEDYVRMSIFTAFVLGRKPVILTGSRSSGKTNIMSVLGTFCPKPVDITSASDKAQIRDDTINNSSHFIVTEINKVSNSFIEILKDIGEGKASEYKALDDMKRPVKFKVDVKPFITSIADENDTVLGDEIISRLITMQTDASMKQNEDVIEEKFKRASTTSERLGINSEHIRNLQDYVKWLPSITDYEFCYLPGTSMMNVIPPFFTDSRRDTDKYLSNTFGIAMFHYEDRIVVDHNGKKVILVTPCDAWYNHRIFHPILKQSSLKCNHVQSIIIDILRKYALMNPHKPMMMIKEMHASLRKNNLTYGVDTVKKFLDELYRNGYILRNEETKPHTYEIIDSFKEWDPEINWHKVVDECALNVKREFPKEAELYIKRFCTSPLIVKDPFTGDEFDMLGEWKKDSVKIEASKENLATFGMSRNDASEPIIKTDDHSKMIGAGKEIPKVILATIEKRSDEEPVRTVNEENIGDDPNMKYDAYFRRYADTDGIIEAIGFETEFGEDVAKKLCETGYIFEPRIGYYKKI